MALDNLSFQGGVHMEDFKYLTSDKPVEEAEGPERVAIAMNQHRGVACQPLVKKGDRVLAGQKIGDSDASMSVPVHASVSGEVMTIEDIFTVDGVKSQAVVIESDGLDEIGYEEGAIDYKALSKSQIIDHVRESGIVGLGGAAFPTHIKLSPGLRVIDTLLINGAECEPYLTADQKVMEIYPDEIIQGAKVLAHLLDVERTIICIEDNKAGAIGKMREAIQDEEGFEVASLETKYPQGDERMLITAVLGREVPNNGLPADVGTIVSNVYTVKAIYDAFFRNKPLYERIVTVTGLAVAGPKCLRVKNGVSLDYLLDQAGGLTDDVGKVVVGGPMMGLSQFSLDVPIVKATGAVIAFNQAQLREEKEGACINCSKCLEVCPVYLEPMNLTKLVRKDQVDRARENRIYACIQCGCCSYICPAKIPLAETIQVGMNEVKRQSARI